MATEYTATWISLTWPHDANLMINVLVDVLLKRDALAPVLYLQLDNTARENKNQYVMAFLAYLIQAGIFSEVVNNIKSNVTISCNVLFSVHRFS